MIHGFFVPIESKNEIEQKTDKALETIIKDNGGFRILLTHRPELLNVYSKYDLDLVFTGHAHGGQVRLPIIGGMFAPGQGVHPKYTKGVYKEGMTQMVLSRGIGNSKFPFRINNRPEIIFVTLERED